MPRLAELDRGLVCALDLSGRSAAEGSKPRADVERSAGLPS